MWLVSSARRGAGGALCTSVGDLAHTAQQARQLCDVTCWRELRVQTVQRVRWRATGTTSLLYRRPLAPHKTGDNSQNAPPWLRRTRFRSRSARAARSSATSLGRTNTRQRRRAALSTFAGLLLRTATVRGNGGQFGERVLVHFAVQGFIVLPTVHTYTHTHWVSSVAARVAPCGDAQQRFEFGKFFLRVAACRYVNAPRATPMLQHTLRSFTLVASASALHTVARTRIWRVKFFFKKKTATRARPQQSLGAKERTLIRSTQAEKRQRALAGARMGANGAKCARKKSSKFRGRKRNKRWQRWCQWGRTEACCDATQCIGVFVCVGAGAQTLRNSLRARYLAVARHVA